MQSQVLQVTHTLNKYRTVIFALILFAIIVALFVVPSAMAEAGRAVGGSS